MQNACWIIMLTFDDLYHYMSRSGVVRYARIIGAVRKLYLLHDKHRTIFLQLESLAGFVVVVYHTFVAIPEYVARWFRGSHYLAFQTKAWALLYVEIWSTWYYRICFCDVQPYESLLYWFRLYLFYSEHHKRKIIIYVECKFIF